MLWYFIIQIYKIYQNFLNTDENNDNFEYFFNETDYIKIKSNHME